MIAVVTAKFVFIVSALAVAAVDAVDAAAEVAVVVVGCVQGLLAMALMEQSLY